MSEKILYRPKEAQQALGIGHATFWKLAKAGVIQVSHSGRMAFVRAESVKAAADFLTSGAGK
jgi:hypothetical protein